MRAAAADLEFEEAARLRDEIRRLEEMDLGLDVESMPSQAGAAGRLPGPRPAGRSMAGRAGTSAKALAKAKARNRHRGRS
jgi:excinuclease ABC subunit B